jgi:prolyl oligopeptidase
VFSEDAKYFAYVICEKGSDWGKVKFRSVETNTDLEDVLENIKFSCLCWTHDNKGVFYNAYPKSAKSDGTAIEKNEFQQLFYHKIGTKQSEDILVASFPDEPDWMGHAEVSDCGNYIIMTISKSCDPVNQLWYFDLRKSNFEIQSNINFVKLVPNFDSKYSYITNEGSVFYFKTNTNKALKYKLVRIDLNNEKLEWNDFVPEKEDVLQEVLTVDKTKLLLNYMHDCKVNTFFDKRYL